MSRQKLKNNQFCARRDYSESCQPERHRVFLRVHMENTLDLFNFYCRLKSGLRMTES